MHAVVPMVSNLTLEPLIPDEGLERPEFKKVLMGLLQHGFEEMLAKNDEAMDEKIDKLYDKINDLQTRIEEEANRYTEERTKLQEALSRFS